MPPTKTSDLRQLAGQTIIMGFDGTEMSDRVRKRLAEIQPSGVILFARNIVGIQQTHTLLRACRDLVETAPFLCVDMEGGLVDRLKNVVAPAPAVESVATSGDPKLFRKHGRIIGDTVRALGFNADFAPVFDLGLQNSKKVLGSRTASADPAEVIEYAREFLRGLKAAGVLGCGKHFPGLGEANLDTHRELPAIQKSWKQLWEQDLLPYRKLRDEVPFVMVAHAAYPAVTRDNKPASLSRKWMEEILRKKIGYRGLIISDDLDMGGVLATASVADAAVETLRAGADIFLVCQKEENASRTYEAVLQQAERDSRFAQRVKEAARRVLAFKKKAREVKRQSSPPSEQVLERLRRQLWELGEQVRLEGMAAEVRL